MNSEATVCGVEVRLVAQTFGGLVEGLSLETARRPAVAKWLRATLSEYLVLVLRGSSLSTEEQLELTAIFGDTIEPWDRHHKHPGEQRVQVITNAGRDSVDYKTSTLYWHSDQSFTLAPSRYTVLHAIRVPSFGGRTLFVDTRGAYDAMNSHLRRDVRDLFASHSFGYIMAGLTAKRISCQAADEDRRKYSDVIHPIVRLQPETGRYALYLSELCVSGVEGLSETESRGILDALYAETLVSQFIYAHQWQTGDTVIWDNAALMHRAEDIPVHMPRVFHRTNTAGEIPSR